MNMADENSAETDAIAAARFITETYD